MVLRKSRLHALLTASSALALGAFVFFATGSVTAHDELGNRPHHIDVPMNPTAAMRAFMNNKAGDTTLAEPAEALATTPCQSNMAGGYACSNIDLHTFMPKSAFGGDRSNDKLNDIWGWTDPATGKEYALVGRVFGTSFIDIDDPDNPVYLGELPTHGNFGSSWRDIKVYNNHAFIVSEASSHGMQVFDLTELRNVNNPPKTFGETAHYDDFGSAHNLVINEESGMAYGVGTNQCSGGLAIVDILDPVNPVDGGCFSGDGYTHDAQCVTYHGPDATHQGSEICLASNEDTLTIVDIFGGANPKQLSKTSYGGSGYTHQGWLTADHKYFIFDDELDERNLGHNTRTRIFDVQDLDNPFELTDRSFDSSSSAIDHNQYIQGRFVYQANYQAGLRVLELAYDAGSVPSLSEFGYFDVYPGGDSANFNGAWSNYPYFTSGTVIVSHIEQGLFILHPNLDRVHFDLPLAHNAVMSGTDVDVQITAINEGVGAVLDVWWTLDNDPAERAPGLWDLSPGPHRLTAFMEDDQNNVTSSEILITIEGAGGTNNPPIAVLDADETNVELDNPVNFDAVTNSYDPDDNVELIFTWQVVTRPKGKNRTNFVDFGGGLAQMTPGKAGLYEIQVTVSDGTLSDQALVAITVTDPDGGGGGGKPPKPCRNPHGCS